MGQIKKILLIITIICCASKLSAQYYSWGSDAPMKWSKIEGERVQVIYPDTTSTLAHHVLHYINSVQGDIAYGYDKPPLDLPFVIHPENFSSNGLVMWMPKRIEFLSTPDVNSYSTLWAKQLVAHEYRHAVQYNNLNNSWIKAVSYILGQQGSALGLAFMPLFAIEGDAVMIETQMSTYGRGLQPSFSMEYRALGDEVLSKRNIDKWFCGSYRDNIPDHYKMGYQFMSYAYEKYNENIWNKATQYTTRNPYLVVSSSAGLHKYYDTNIETLSRETFAELNELWRPLRQIPNSTEIISEVDSTDYTTYSYPIALGNGEVLALKSSFASTNRFVVSDGDGNERVVAKIGSISSRPSYGGGRVWWSEYRSSKLFEERVNSLICYMDLAQGKTKQLRGVNKAILVEAIGDDPDHIAYVEYSPNGVYKVVERNGDQEVRRLGVRFPAEVHGLAWDDATRKLYVIVTDDSGMWLGVESGDGFEPLHEGRYITISNLRAKDGTLYFGSIASGMDEAHSFEIGSGIETQITRSTYGSFQPSTPNDQGEIYATTYDKYGYHLSSQKVSESVGEIYPMETPLNIVNPERRSLGLINIDNVRFEVADSIEMASKNPSKRYSKGGHLFNLHSWAPARFNPFELMDEQSFDIGLGATLISQNQLSSCESFLAYGYDLDQGSLVEGAFKYTGLGVEFELGASYGGDRQIYTFTDMPLPSYSISKYTSVSLSASLPLFFARGYVSHYLTLSAGWSYSNGLVLDLDNLANTLEASYNKGLNKLSFGAGFGTYTRASYRDFATPLGFYIFGGYAMNPTNRDFSSLISTYAKVYLPGILPHNSLTLEVNYQKNIGGFEVNGYAPLGYSSVYILPQGYLTSDILNNNYLASALNYEFPVWYPDGGIEGVIYFKRLRLKGGVEYAQFDNYEGQREQIYSYGGGIVVDTNFLRLPSSGTTEVNFSIYKPHNRNLNYEVGLSIPF
ncbi:MAG: hypothetical protein SNG02_04400 [Rikenellaceae bacterium]